MGHKKINMEQMEDCNEAASITSKAAEVKFKFLKDIFLHFLTKSFH